MRLPTAILALAVLLCGSGWAADPANANNRLGLNLSGVVDWTAEFPFVDAFKTSRAWISQINGGSWGSGPALDLDADGWVRTLAPNCYAETLIYTNMTGHCPTGDHIVLYDGQGTMTFGGKASVQGSSPGRILVRTSGAFSLRITATTGGDHLRNIRVIMPGYEATYRTQIFRPGFIDMMKTYNTIRFMDWMDTNNSPISTWAERPKLTDATWTVHGPPLEILIELCNRTHANPWLCMPHLATDDYISRSAAMVRERLDPSLRPYIEFSNEVWNGMFQQAKWAKQQGQAANLSSNGYEAQLRFYSRCAVRMFDLWTAAYGGNGRFVRVMASHAANTWVSQTVLGYENAKAKTDALAIAPYFSCNVGASQEDAVEGWTVAQVISHLRDTSIPQTDIWMRDHKQVATTAGVPRLICYESGQHCVGVEGVENNATITSLLNAANRDPGMNQLYQTYLTNWKNRSNDLICLFASVGPYSKWGSWGLQEYLDLGAADSPKLAGVLAWRAAHPDSNQAPVLGLGGNRTAAVGTSVSLTPTISDDGLSKMPVLASWTASSPAVTFANPASASTTVSANAAGTYTLTLTADDGMVSSRGSITFTVTSGSGGGGTPSIVLSTTTLPVNEGGTATFQVRLSAQPAASTTITVARTAGDSSVTVSSGASLAFTTANWNTSQTVTLAAAQDADTANGSATITVSASGLASRTLAATEVDDDTSSDGGTSAPGGGSGGTGCGAGGALGLIGCGLLALRLRRRR